MKNLSAAARVDGLLHDLLQASGFSLTHHVGSSHSGSNPPITVEFEGPDAELLTAHGGELLLAMEHIAAEVIRLEAEERDLLSFDAGGWKADRNRKLSQSVDVALLEVRATGRPYKFPPMSSHERRLLHLALAPSGFGTVSEGEGAMRHLVLKPVA